MLAQSQRLRKSRDFERLYRKGQFARSAHFVLRYSRTSSSQTRFGVVVAKKVLKKAVARNRAKRRTTEILRLHQAQTKPGYDCVLLLKQDIVELSHTQLESELINLVTKAGIVK